MNKTKIIKRTIGYTLLGALALGILYFLFRALGVTNILDFVKTFFIVLAWCVGAGGLATFIVWLLE